MQLAESLNKVQLDAEPGNRVELAVRGMHCAGCVGQVESALKDVRGVKSASVDLASGTAVVSGTLLDATSLVHAIQAQGFSVSINTSKRSIRDVRSELERKQTSEVREWRNRATVGILLWLPIVAIHMPMDLGLVHFSRGFHQTGMTISAVFATISQIYVGWGFYRSAINALSRFSANMDSLIALGSTVAWLFSSVVMSVEQFGIDTDQPVYWEASAGLLALVSLGHWLEARSMVQASSALRELLSLQPDRVQRIKTLTELEGVEIDSADINAGDLFVIKPGDRIAVDGEIVLGSSSLDESVVTGEPIPIDKSVGSPVIAGSMNTIGRLVVRATTGGRETTIARIAEMVRTAQSSKAEIARLADRVCAVFVPAVMLTAFMTFGGWVIHGFWNGNLSTWMGWSTAITAATTVLVISCPCALGLATPTAIMVGAGAASRRGILVKSAISLERAARLTLIVLDKTGTLTEGKPSLDRHWIRPDGNDQPLRIAIGLANLSKHPLSKAISEFGRTQGIEPAAVSQFEEIAGQGLRGVVSGVAAELLSTSAALKKLDSIPPDLPNYEGTKSVLLWNGEVVGAFWFQDQVRPGAAMLINKLRKDGLKVKMLTGDNRAAGLRVAEQVGIGENDAFCDLSPGQKQTIVRQLNQGGDRVAMVGDGINDAAALAEAGSVQGLGIAIGTGTNIAIESADVVVPGHRLESIMELIELSQKTVTTVKQNLLLSFIYNAAMIPLAAFGILGARGPVWAAAAMALSDLSVVGNSLRLKSNLSQLSLTRATEPTAEKKNV